VCSVRDDKKHHDIVRSCAEIALRLQRHAMTLGFLRPLRALCETYYPLAQMRRYFGDFDGFGLKFIAPNAM
jgi:hypothetical protein